MVVATAGVELDLEKVDLTKMVMIQDIQHCYNDSANTMGRNLNVETIINNS